MIQIKVIVDGNLKTIEEICPDNYSLVYSANDNKHINKIRLLFLSNGIKSHSLLIRRMKINPIIHTPDGPIQNNDSLPSIYRIAVPINEVVSAFSIMNKYFEGVDC